MTAEGMTTLRWGTDYLLKTISKAKGSTAKEPVSLIVSQVLPCLYCSAVEMPQLQVPLTPFSVRA